MPVIPPAILALNPMLLWPLDDAAGSFSARDLSPNHVIGAVANEINFGAFGPEPPATAARIFTSGSILSPALGWAGWRDFSIMAMITVPANATPTAQTPIMGVGDYTNPTGHGAYLKQQSTSANSLAWFGGGPSNASTLQPGYPVMYWHLVTLTYTNATPAIRLYVDGNQGTLVSATPGTAFSSADTFWIYSNAAAVVADAALFNYALSQAQVQTVSQEIVPWPYSVPVNSPIPVGSTNIDLTPVLDGQTTIIDNQNTFMPQIVEIQNEQDAQSTILGPIPTGGTAIAPTVNTLEQQVTGIINTTFPSLNDLINLVLQGVTASMTGVGGVVSKTLGQIFSGFTLDTLTESDRGTVCFPDTFSDTQPMGGSPFGAAFQVTSYADWYTFMGIGDFYSQQVLFVLDISRGGVSVLHQGIHILNHLVYPMPGLPNFPVYGGLPVDPGEYVITVVPNVDVCVNIKILTFP